MNRISSSLQSPLQALQTLFGYEAFRGPQEAVIGELMAGRDALVLMPTGGGKSLCYQIPAILRNGVGVVISPLIALMQDQVDALRQVGVNAGFLNSSLSLAELRDMERALLDQELDMLYIAPERLTQERTLELLQRTPISLFAIDEAHCVSQWGHDFRADYLQLNLLQERFPHVPRVALTATADERTRKEIAERLGLTEAQHFISGFDRPNIQYRITQKQNARQQLLRFLRAEHASDAGIVYCLSRNKVEQVAEWLCKEGFNALPYHAGLPADVRQEHQQRFLREDGVIVVATIAFGMGIDKPDVRFVAHLDLPKSIESYYQETGRAGRDGLPSTAWMAYGLQDVIKLRQMMEGSPGAEQFKRAERQKLDAMLGLCEIVSCRRRALLRYFGETAPEQCGNCDACLNPAETWDATVAAQKALSCIYRTGQRFGVNHLIDVVRGELTDKVKQFGHERLPTFGVGEDMDAAQWRSVLRQLTARGLLNVDLDGFGALKLTESCRPILRGEQEVRLRRDVKEVVSKAPRRSGESLREEDQPLWDALRIRRKELAEEQGVAPYMIFHDATLMEILRHRPQNEMEFLALNGVGKSKLERYGEDFMEIVRNA
ncbi:DNA helicase RecQ [Hahella sp. NBU794]|uniref:DNA helicase RecQ n=1 Tax=Hahella sp. NBU794 TaxID=3422590 RepID=UPI003D6EA0B2